jgi:hypothetical protein
MEKNRVKRENFYRKKRQRVMVVLINTLARKRCSCRGKGSLPLSIRRDSISSFIETTPREEE